MARVNWQGTEIQAELVDQLPNGNYRMKALGRAPRVEPGTIIEVKPSEIVGLSIGGVNFNGPGAPPAPAAAPIILTKADVAPLAPAAPKPQDQTMGTPLVEIKGLGNAITSVRSGLAGVRALAADVQVSAGALHAELTDLKGQIEDARTQIKTEASIMGNSPAA
jgi:hypothetical protein